MLLFSEGIDMTKSVRIVSDGVFGIAKTDIEIDGKNIACHVSEFSIDVKAGEVGQLTLSVLPYKLFEYSGETAVRVRPELADLLTGIGWTAPEQ